jgi:hypothetical protein
VNRRCIRPRLAGSSASRTTEPSNGFGELRRVENDRRRRAPTPDGSGAARHVSRGTEVGSTPIRVGGRGHELVRSRTAEPDTTPDVPARRSRDEEAPPSERHPRFTWNISSAAALSPHFGARGANSMTPDTTEGGTSAPAESVGDRQRAGWPRAERPRVYSGPKEWDTHYRHSSAEANPTTPRAVAAVTGVRVPSSAARTARFRRLAKGTALGRNSLQRRRPARPPTFHAERGRRRHRMVDRANRQWRAGGRGDEAPHENGQRCGRGRGRARRVAPTFHVNAVCRSVCIEEPIVAPSSRKGHDARFT